MKAVHQCYIDAVQSEGFVAFVRIKTERHRTPFFYPREKTLDNRA